MKEPKKAVLIVSHGSRSKKTKIEIESLVDGLRARFPGYLVAYAFLELEEPLIPDGIRQCVEAGATTVFVTLNFLNAGRHVDEDIPGIVRAAAAAHPEITIKLTAPLGRHPRLPDLFVDLVERSDQDGAPVA